MTVADPVLRPPPPVAVERAVPTSSGASADRSATTVPRLLTFNAVFGDLVANEQGEALGTLNELLLDLVTGRIAYAVVSSGGFMGKGERLYPVPWSAFSRDSNRHCFVVAVQKARFEAGPGFDQVQWPSVFTAALHLQIHRHYGLGPYWV